jgi:hypothetical protein
VGIDLKQAEPWVGSAHGTQNWIGNRVIATQYKGKLTRIEQPGDCHMNLLMDIHPGSESKVTCILKYPGLSQVN